MLLPGLASRERAIALAGRVAAVCSEPIVIGDRTMTVGCSIGLAIAPDDGLDAGRLLNRADAALYRAKQRGRGRVEVFDDELAYETEQRAFLEGRLRTALERREIELAYQRQLDGSGAEVGFEALARWQPTGSDPVPPAVFVPLAEELGLIGEIGAFVIREACAQAAVWRAAGAERRICVNVSPVQLADPGLCAVVRETLEATGLPHGMLELELTESALIENGCLSSRLAELRALGVRIALDDFGTGYSSLARLRSFPLDVLKVDRSFVAEIGGGTGTPIVRAVIELAHTLGLEVVAEGIETEEQRRVVAGLGCDRLQGYLLGWPGPAPALVADQATRPEAA
jgi:predicted signal transduction protein with EAL and GGDEF domain